MSRSPIKEPRAKFAIYLHKMITCEPDSTVKWTRGGTAFKIMNVETFMTRRPEYNFKGTNYGGFKRQLTKYYSFNEIGENEYHHKDFKINEEGLAAKIPRAICSITPHTVEVDSPADVDSAAEKHVCKKAKTMVQCSACKSEFTKEALWPFVLDCGHVLCNLCWDDWNLYCRGKGQSLTCIMCKVPTQPAKRLLCH
jgi:hypothetical protein